MHVISNPDRQLAHSLVTQLIEKYEQEGIEISHANEMEALSRVLLHMHKYVKTYNVLIKSIDVYKIISWFAFELHKVLKNDWIIMLTAHILNDLLEVDTDKKYKHSDIFVTKIALMALNDKHIAGHDSLDFLAVGMNGFYLAFKSPSIMYLGHDSAQKSIPTVS